MFTSVGETQEPVAFGLRKRKPYARRAASLTTPVRLMKLNEEQRKMLLGLKPQNFRVPPGMDEAECVWWHYFYRASLRNARGTTKAGNPRKRSRDVELEKFMVLLDDHRRSGALTVLQVVKVKCLLKIVD